MSNSFEKSVKGATKIKNAPPKTKYIEHILVATHSGEAGVGEVFRALQNRLRDSTWTVVFKSLITVHFMIREGSPDVTLSFLAGHRNMLAISSFTDAQTQGRNIRHYSNYLAERAHAFRETKTDWVRAPETRLERLTVEKGLLRETEIVQQQLSALLKCDVMEAEPENEITITVFRLLVLDLLALYQILNQGLITVLSKFFEMSKPDAERAMSIYRTFTRQTDYVVQYLSVARLHEHHTRVEVPKLKHAPVNLGRQLDEYLNDPHFETNRRQYLAEQESKGGKSSSGSKPTLTKKADRVVEEKRPEPASNNPFPTTNTTSKPAAETKPASKPDGDLIDFFDSIELNQTPLQLNTGAQQQPFQAQPTGIQFQTNGFGNTGFQQPQQQQQPPPPQQLQPNFTGAGGGGFTPQPQGFQPGSLASIPQNGVPDMQNGQQVQPQLQQQQSFPTPQPPPQAQPQMLQPMQTGSTNPFRQSMLMAQNTGMPNLGVNNTAGNRMSTNPFARSPQQNSSPFQQQQPPQQQLPQAQIPQMPLVPPQPQQQPAPLVPAATGTNPFARQSTLPTATPEQRPQTAGGPLAPQPTGSTNPFRQGAFVNHSTGLGWQHNQAPIGGGLDQLPTAQVFPRPLQQTPWQQ